VAIKKPEVRSDIQFGNDFPFAVLTALIADMGDTVHHQHVR
jgi:hypothetical protein